MFATIKAQASLFAFTLQVLPITYTLDHDEENKCKLYIYITLEHCILDVTSLFYLFPIHWRPKFNILNNNNNLF